MNRIKALIMDVDGTLTDGNIYMGNDGEVMKAFNTKDGYGITNIALKNEIVPIIVTGRKSKIVSKRGKELGIKIILQNVKNKEAEIARISKEIPYEQIAFIGDDINDLEAIKLINLNGGLTGCPNDAVKLVKENVAYLCSLDGGHGAVREFIDWIVNEKMS